MAPRRFTMQGPDPDKPAPAPLQFVLDGQTLPTKARPESEPWEETFTVLPDLPPGALADLSAGATVNSEGDVVWQRLSVLRFVRSVLIPEDEGRWDVLMRDKRRPVRLDVLGQVMFHITAEKSGRPTGPPPGSDGGSQGTTDGSEPDSPTPDTPTATSTDSEPEPS